MRHCRIRQWAKPKELREPSEPFSLVRARFSNTALKPSFRKLDACLARVSFGMLPCPARTVIRSLSALPLSRFSRTLKGMEVHFSPDVETQLRQVASANGKDAEQLVKDTVARMLESQVRFIAEVQRGIAQADGGEFVEHKDVVDRIDRLFHS